LTIPGFFPILKKIWNMIKKGKQIKVQELKNYKSSYGTVDKTNPKSMYITINSWAQPKTDDVINYSKVIRNLNKKIKDWLYNNLDVELFNKNNTIVDLDLRVSGIQANKRSYMSCEITLFKNTDELITSDLIQEKSYKIINGIIRDIFKNHDFFTFHKSKRIVRDI
jgi:hypothetical protein